MSRINLDTRLVPAASQALLTQIHAAFGATPAMFKAVANSPAALQSMWGAFGALSGGNLGAPLGEKIAVAIANRNRCEYCLAAHTMLGRKAGVDAQTMAAAQAGHAGDLKTSVALTFALKVVENRAQVDAADVAALHDVGFNDSDVAELMAHIALNVFTNYINVALDVPVDFPKIALI